MRAGIIVAGMLSACTTYNQSGELVRHHFGYVRIVTPSYAGEAPVQALGVNNYGLWIDVDRREANQRSGSGLGVGYRSDNRSILPHTCRIIFRVETMEQFNASVALLESSDIQGEDLCVIREESL